ncbi:bifunctional diguanylate cyclase/phosphodiesterase [Litchfieldia salsa]|uniref:bifunctional diguanylate cyclase/phosphodiesterase n=1 Tax=Litchfieldia salsa TaxID=930152 RepID=UPI00111419F1|nr:EAL domain-containing protein [Litchfieldia salsa]
MRPNTNTNSLFNIYKSLFDNNTDPCYAMDLEGTFLLFNQSAVDMSGYTSEEATKMSFVSIIDDEYVDTSMNYFNKVLAGNRVKFEMAMRHKNGKKIELSVTSVPLFDHEGQICGIVGMAKEITEQKKLETLLAGQNQVLEMIAKGSKFTDVLASIIFLIESVSEESLCSILLVDKTGERLVHGSSPNLPDKYSTYINGIYIGPNAGSCGVAAHSKRTVIVSDIATDPLWSDYKEIALQYGLRASWSSPVFDNQQEVLGVFAMYYKYPSVPTERDKELINEATHLTSLAIQHYKAEETINYMAFHDDLTNLPNRRLFSEKVKEAISRHKDGNGRMLALMYLDLDRFKLINDSLGHNVGDALLKEVAYRVRKCLRDTDIVSRQAGDEFTILLQDILKIEVSSIAQHIIESLAKPFMVKGHEIFITPSIGISFYPVDGGDVDDLITKADIAMYQAKKEGRNTYQFYDVKLDKKTFERLEIENELRKAIDRDEFSLHYQPILNLCKNQVTGVEALIRWNNEKLGTVSPAQFIPIAEETGMIITIGEWIFSTACKQLKKWENEGFALSISVNISIRQFYQPNLIPMIESILKETNVSPEYLTIEITESMTMDVETATNILQDLKELGVNISIDDFGTGYSSLSYLKSFPIDYLKIDQSFIRDITKSKGDESIATTILLMAHNLGLKVIAEGVETKGQLEMLKKHRCDEAQGYLFSKPLPVEELEQFDKFKETKTTT